MMQLGFFSVGAEGCVNGKSSRAVQNERGKCNSSSPCAVLLPHLTVLLSLGGLGVSSECQTSTGFS